MLQTLFYIPAEVFPWLLVPWAVGSVVLVAWLVRRQGWSADTLAYLPLLAAIGAVLGIVLPWLSQEQGLPIYGYGVMLLVAVSSGVWLAAYRARRMGIDPEVIYSLAFWLFVAGIIGARMFYVVEYWDEYRQGSLGETLLAIANITRGGLVVYGAAIGAGLALIAFVRKHRLPGLALADLVAPSLMLGLALGRIGCFLNGCCFGGTCDLPWAVRFAWKSPPHVAQVERGQLYLHGLKLSGAPGAPATIAEVEPGSPAAREGLEAGDVIVRIRVRGEDRLVRNIAEAHQALLSSYGEGERIAIFTSGSRKPAQWTLRGKPPRSLPVHPAQLYSALDAGLLCLFLLAWYPYRRRDGEVIALLVTIHPVARFLLEMIRTDESAVFGTGLSISQNLSLLMLCGAAGLWLYLTRRPRRLVWPAQVAAA